MSEPEQIPSRELPPGTVRRVGRWAVGNRDGELFAVSRRCRHQLADLSKGSLDADGCLVCPWHQSRYDVRSGAMVGGRAGCWATTDRLPATPSSCSPTAATSGCASGVPSGGATRSSSTASSRAPGTRGEKGLSARSGSRPRR